MTSLCSHHVPIVLMTSSHLDHDIIATCVNHDCSPGHDRQTLHVTGRPSRMTYRPWQMTGRPKHDLEACDMLNQ